MEMGQNVALVTNEKLIVFLTSFYADTFDFVIVFFTL